MQVHVWGLVCGGGWQQVGFILMFLRLDSFTNTLYSHSCNMMTLPGSSASSLNMHLENTFGFHV